MRTLPEYLMGVLAVAVSGIVGYLLWASTYHPETLRKPEVTCPAPVAAQQNINKLCTAWLFESNFRKVKEDICR